MDALENKSPFYVSADAMTSFGTSLDLGIPSGPTTSYEGDPNDYKEPTSSISNYQSGSYGGLATPTNNGSTGKTVATVVGVVGAAALLGWLGSKMINNAKDKNEANKAVSLQSLKTQENLAKIQADAAAKKYALDAKNAPILAAQQAKSQQQTIMYVAIGGGVLLLAIVVIALSVNRPTST